MAELSDAQVFGSTSTPPAATKEMSDADVYGLAGYVEPGTNTTGVDPDVDPRVADAVSSFVKSLVAPSPTGEDNPALDLPRSARQPAARAGRGQGDRKGDGRGLAGHAGSILTPEDAGVPVDQFLWPLGKYFVNPLFRVANAIPGAATNALMYGGAELANQVTGDPRAGRDALMIAQVAPMARNGVIASPGDLPPTEPTPAPRPQFVSERAAPDVSGLDPRNAIQTLIQHDIEENPPTLAPGQGAANQGTASPLAPPPGVEPVTRAAPLMDNFNQGEAPPGTANQGTVSPPAPTVPHAPLTASGGQWNPVNPDAPGFQMPTDGSFRINPTTGASEIYEPMVAAVDQPAPGPQSGGAAASRDGTDPAVLTAKTPAQALNDFRTSVTQTARDRASPGVTPGTVEDHTVYVPGVKRLESARVFDPDVAGNHDALRDIDPAYKTAADKIEQDNHDILKDTYLQQAGDTNSVAALEDQRNAVSPNALGVFQNERPVSAQPVADAIQAIKDSPAWKIDAVRNVMQKVEKGLYDANGNLETMPSQLYGARQNLTTIRDSNALTQEASDAKTARYQLGQVLAPLDQVIGEGSNGYKDVYLPQWANYSRLIDQQRYLQSKTLGAGKVTGADGNLTANGMQKLLDQIAVDKGKPGNNPAKTLTEPQLDNLVAIRNELAAMQYRDQLAKSSGSPTVKKAAAAARLGNPVLNAARETAIHGVLAHTTGGAGNVVYQLGVKPIMERGRERKAAAIMETMRNRLLNTNIPTE